ncbi:MAG: outer membrane lipoprotein-sorting protein [bacterium]|nr:outer membrane lipoprotein-sorting protein [bacterium]
MQLQKLISLIMVLIMSWAISATAQDLSALDIVKKSDATVNAPKDQYLDSKMILINKNGDQKVRKTVMYQKGDEKRLIRFLSPADQKGIGFLSLPNDINYLYLPAFHKVRKIASHIKNQSFAGTDFSYDDMSSFKYAEEYDPKLLETTGENYVLELTPKANLKKDYSKLKMLVAKESFYPVKIEHYDKAGNLWKVWSEKKLLKKVNIGSR